MNKVIAVLGIIVLLTLAMLFFCIGFFTGSNITPGNIASAVAGDMTAVNAILDPAMEEKKEIINQMSAINDSRSATLSDKVMNILAAAGYSIESFSGKIKGKPVIPHKNDKISSKAHEGHLTVDALLREISATHNPNDDCSYNKTLNVVNTAKPAQDRTLNGKKVVFIGYFKGVIAAQIQKLLTSKGYKTHVEASRSSDGHEAFVFCGPFKRDDTANKLLNWLQLHDFSEARIISVTKEAVEETLYDAMNDGNGLPQNAENVVVPANATGINGIAPNGVATGANGLVAGPGTTAAGTTPGANTTAGVSASTGTPVIGAAGTTAAGTTPGANATAGASAGTPAVVGNIGTAANRISGVINPIGTAAPNTSVGVAGIAPTAVTTPNTALGTNATPQVAAPLASTTTTPNIQVPRM